MLSLKGCKVKISLQFHVTALKVSFSISLLNVLPVVETTESLMQKTKAHIKAEYYRVECCVENMVNVGSNVTLQVSLV